ncbi:hypothetical protein MASR1M90_21060 [Desulfovibrionales bacterium]
MRAVSVLVLGISLVLNAVLACAAESWNTTLGPSKHLPALFLAVDKEIQRAYFVRTTTAPRLDTEKLRCTTGQRDGDKLRRGDLKTPEGIYFIEEKISSGLDFTLYGNTAFPLNYPNPIDRIRGKTGSGIWVHGRGTPLDPKLTRGCVAMPNPVVDTLDQHITLHQTPVLIAQQLTWTNATLPASEDIARKTWSWVIAHEQAADRLFSLYDPEYMAKSTGMPFAQFMQHQKNKYLSQTWQDVRISPIHILHGPGYVVSFFTQKIHTATTSIKGWRRLYWVQRDEQWKIAGEEWVAPHPVPHEDYVRTVEHEIQEALRKEHLGARRAEPGPMPSNSTHAGQRSADANQDAQGFGAARYSVRPQMHIALTAQGVEARIPGPNATTQTHIFLPGPFDSWVLQSGKEH